MVTSEWSIGSQGHQGVCLPRGQKSLYEAAYHGVPVVAFPLFADQHRNAKKAEHFGLGIAVNHKTLDAQQLFETIERVMNDPR